ncbi:hypothetical protein [Gordonibacter pamelaeae]|uniref:hypothetical protein n=1 Tax=Gordonibacter pamelaeae TaxID=471189 RepID=UPI0024313F7B|nr:hypothetical protein [Gordonibacter pamelaeae]
MDTLTIVGAREGNLCDVTLAIPKNKITVFTGVSGSGKSTLLVDVLATECQRLHLEALSMQGIPKPAVERVRGASPAFAILQDGANRNPRSTVGTATDVYTALRMVFEKLGEYPCPHCGQMLCAADCAEETERVGDASTCTSSAPRAACAWTRSRARSSRSTRTRAPAPRARAWATCSRWTARPPWTSPGRLRTAPWPSGRRGTGNTR